MKSIQRHRYFLDFTLSSLLRRKWKNISLVIVYTTIVFLITSVLFFANAIRKEAQAVLQDAPEMIIQKVIAGRKDLIPFTYADKITNSTYYRSLSLDYILNLGKTWKLTG